MFKKGILGLVISLGLSTGLAANDTLKADMAQLAKSVSAAQAGFFANDKAMTLAAIVKLKTDARKILGDEKSIKALLPKEIQYKSSIAVNSADMIVKYAQQIEDTLDDKNMRMINQQMRSQTAFTEILDQCFRCHNLVRDWK